MTTQEMLAAEFGTLPLSIRHYASVQPDAAALVLGERRMSYAKLDRLVDRVAAALQRDGVKPRDTVAICAAGSIEYCAVFFGALRAGAAVAPLAPSSTPQSLLAMLLDSDARHFFVDAATAELMGPVTIPSSVRCVSLDAARFEDWLAPEGTVPREISARPDDPFNIIYSSGTTGTPKGIVHPNSMRWAQVHRAIPLGFGPGGITVVATPLYSNTTLVSFLPAIACGGTVALMQKFDVEKFLALSERERAEIAMLVPVQYRRIMEFPDFGRFDLSSYRMKFCTSAPFSAALKADVLKRWPGGLIEYYGLTEGGATCALLAHEFPEKLHTVGRLRPGHEIRLLDEDGKEVAAGEAGEIVGRSPGMMTGYHNQPEMTAAAEWHDAAGNRFIRTGDIGRFDDDGFLILMDRRKDLIISGGFNIYPSDLEAVLATHEAVAEAAVVAAPSDRWGETPVAFIVPRPGHALCPEKLRLWANEKLGRTQRISEVRLKTDFPRSPIGKVLKRELREELAS